MTDPGEKLRIVLGFYGVGLDLEHVHRSCSFLSGWIAFDDRVYLFQPHHPPVPGGG